MKDKKYFRPNAFNDFYINIGSNLSGKIIPNNPYINQTSYIKNNVTDNIFIAPATNAKIPKIFDNLKKQCRVGWFNTIPAQTNIFERN